jgi:hypothetical protein
LFLPSNLRIAIADIACRIRPPEPVSGIRHQRAKKARSGAKSAGIEKPQAAPQSSSIFAPERRFVAGRHNLIMISMRRESNQAAFFSIHTLQPTDCCPRKLAQASSMILYTSFKSNGLTSTSYPPGEEGRRKTGGKAGRCPITLRVIARSKAGHAGNRATSAELQSVEGKSQPVTTCHRLSTWWDRKEQANFAARHTMQIRRIGSVPQRDSPQSDHIRQRMETCNPGMLLFPSPAIRNRKSAMRLNKT